MVRVAVLATHGLGSACLKRLEANEDIEIPIVVTYPPEEQTWWDEKVYKTAKALDLTVEPIANEREILQYDVEYVLSVYYPNILDGELLTHPSEGALNLHQAELPRYRGSNVFAHAIMNARQDDYWQYGTTLHQMVEEVDAGPIIDRKFVPIRENDTARTLYDRTKRKSIELFEKWIPRIADKSVLNNVTPQTDFDGERYFYTKQSLEGLFEIEPSRLSAKSESELLAVYDQIRAMEFPPLDPAHTTVAGEQVYLTTRAGTEKQEE